MNKKAFTLVELLGTVVVLSIILIIAVPSIMDTMRRANINEAKAFITKLYNASESYIEINRSAFEQLNTTNGRVDIPVKYLLDEGLIRELGDDPTTMTPITINHTVTATRQADGTIAYALYSGNTNIESYVTNGLILHLDAINNFGMGHSNTTTVWNDLSSQHNDVLGVNPIKWTNKSLTFSTVSDILKTKNTVTSALLGKNVTMEIYLKSNELRYVELGIPGAMTLKLRISGQNPYWNPFPVTIQSYGAQYTIGAQTSYVYRNNFTGSVADKWFNGAKTSATVSNLAAVTDHFVLGNSEYLNGEIYSIRLYNRALSDAEIQANYALDQNRYR